MHIAFWDTFWPFYYFHFQVFSGVLGGAIFGLLAESLGLSECRHPKSRMR